MSGNHWHSTGVVIGDYPFYKYRVLFRWGDYLSSTNAFTPDMKHAAIFSSALAAEIYMDRLKNNTMYNNWVIERSED